MISLIERERYQDMMDIKKIEKSFHSEDSQAAQRCQVVSVFGGLQDSAGHNTEQLVWPQIWDYFEQDTGLEMSQSPFLPQLLSDSYCQISGVILQLYSTEGF